MGGRLHMDRALAVAVAVADTPQVRRALSTPDPSRTLQPFAEQVRRDSRTDFVVVMGLDRTRYSHPNPAEIGGRFVGDLGPAPRGGQFTQEYTGTLGRSMRAVVPVFDGTGSGRVVALVSVGITAERIQDALADRLPAIGLAAVTILAVGLLGAWLISRRLRRQTHGLGEREITRMYEYYDAVLHAVREGLLLRRADGRVQLLNDEAQHLLGLGDGAVGRFVGDLGLPPSLVRAIRSRGPAARRDPPARRRRAGGQHRPRPVAGPRRRPRGDPARPHRAPGRRRGARHRPRARGVAAGAEPRGVQPAAHGRLPGRAGARRRGPGLRHRGARDRPAAHRPGGRSVSDPVVSALLLGKTAPAAERGVQLRIAEGTDVTGLPVDQRDAVTILGNLVDNAIDAVGDADTRVVLVDLTGSPPPSTYGSPTPATACRRPWSTRSSSAAGRPRPRRPGRARAGAGARRPGRSQVRRPRRRRGLGARRRPVRRTHRDRVVTAPDVSVLVVEDEELSAQAHADYVRRTAGFALAGVARSSVEALRALRRTPVDLVLLDMHLPDGHGLALLRRMRSEGILSS